LEAVRPNASRNLRRGHGRNDTISRNTRCSTFMHIIINPFIINSGFHFSMIALFRMKLRSYALALCAIATIFSAQGLGSVRYVSRSHTVSCQNECFLLPHRKQSSPSLHREQNCCTQTRLGTCNFVSAVYSVFWVVPKS